MEDNNKKFDKEKQHEFGCIYIIPILGIPFLPILFFSSRVSMFGKFIAFVMQFCLSGMIFIIFFTYIGFCHGR